MRRQAARGAPLPRTGWRDPATNADRWLIWRMVRWRRQASRGPTRHPHDLRHTAASLAISSGANAKAVQRMLGHKSAAMTLDVYADLFEDDLDAVAVAMNEAAVRALARQ